MDWRFQNKKNSTSEEETHSCQTEVWRTTWRKITHTWSTSFDHIRQNYSCLALEMFGKRRQRHVAWSGRIMLWGCFGVSVPWTLVKVEGIMKNENILKENLKQSPTNLCLGRCSWWSECNWLPCSKLWPENRRGEPKTKVHQIWRSLMYLPKKAELGLFRRNNSRLLNKKDTQLVTRI